MLAKIAPFNSRVIGFPEAFVALIANWKRIYFMLGRKDLDKEVGRDPQTDKALKVMVFGF